MNGLPIADAPLTDEEGWPNRFTYLAEPAWRRVSAYFGPVIDGRLYLSILLIRIIGKQWRDAKRVKELAGRCPEFIETTFFDEAAYSGTTRQRMAAAMVWAIAEQRGEDPMDPSQELRAVAFCLSEPMLGGELA